MIDFLYVTVPMALCIALFFLGLFIFAFRKGQFEDIESPKYRMFFDDDDSPK